MEQLLENTGIFLYPLGLFSILAILVIVERIFALRGAAVVPAYQKSALFEGQLPALKEKDHSIAAELVRFFEKHQPDAETFRSFARLQVNRLDRGLFLLDVVISGAPLVGLLGTVTGLVEVFATFSEQSGLPNPEEFVSGISLALTTTIVGLSIAIPAMIAAAYFNRRVDKLSARLEVVVEHLLSRKHK